MMKRWKWKDQFYVRAFELAKSGMSNTEIAKVIGCNAETFSRMVKEKEALREALDRGRNSEGGYAAFRNFVYGRLSKSARRFWDELDELDKMELKEKTDRSSGRLRKKKFLEILQSPAKVQQQLFIHALVCCNFVLSEAAKKTGISPQLVRMWVTNSPGFKELLQGIQEVKGDFFESCLVNLCRSGDTTAIIFANRTFNRGRGYNDKVEMEINRKTEVTHRVKVDDLPVDARRAILDRMREVPQLEDRRKEEEVIDVQFSEIPRKKK
jgi:hypothetical protein